MEMLAIPGNMADVYAEFWRMQETADDAERRINIDVAVAGGIFAEITDGASADWYLVRTYPGDDLRAMRWLARRRFGVFRPMQQRIAKQREGQRIGVMEPVFPGHLFVYVWGIEKMRSRLLACPGVSGILCTTDGRPFPVNEIDEETGKTFIERLREQSWVYSESLARTNHESERRQRNPKPPKRERKALCKLKKALKRSGKFDHSTWTNAAALAPAKRIALLMQTLLGPVAPQCGA